MLSRSTAGHCVPGCTACSVAGLLTAQVALAQVAADACDVDVACERSNSLTNCCLHYAVLDVRAKTMSTSLLPELAC